MSKRSIRDYSAFDFKIFEPLGFKYYAQYSIQLAKLLERVEKLKIPPHYCLDTLTLFYFDAERVAEHFKKPPTTAWQLFLQKFITSPEYLKINKLTKGNLDLTFIASFQLLSRLFSQPTIKTARTVKKILVNSKSITENELKYVIQYLVEKIEKDINYFLDAKKVIESDCGMCLASITGGSNYSLFGLSAISFLENPDEFRRKVMLIKGLVNAMKFFVKTLPSTIRSANVESSFGAVTGVTVIRDLTQIVDVLPTELALPKALSTIRLYTLTALARQRGASFEPVIFIDKSGSMDEPITGSQDIPKISCACGLALVLYKQFGAEIYMFDTEVHKIKPNEVINVLLRARASGGTNINEVLKTISELPTGKQYIVITDAICHVDESLAKQVSRSHKVVFAVLPPSGEASWLKHFKHVHVRDISDLVKAVKLAQ